MDFMKTTSTSHETASEPSYMMNVCIKQQCMANTTEHVDSKSSQPVTQLIAERTLQLDPMTKTRTLDPYIETVFIELLLNITLRIQDPNGLSIEA